MQQHIDGLQGVVYSEALAQVLAPVLGKPAAQAAVAECAAQALSQAEPLHLLLGRWLQRRSAAIDPQITKALAEAVDPRQAVQSSAQACQDLLALIHTTTDKEPAHARHQ
jgi:3-carboxy-cis,cis-muconate cycloisomerase